jgi:hypothetical protein
MKISTFVLLLSFISVVVVSCQKGRPYDPNDPGNPANTGNPGGTNSPAPGSLFPLAAGDAWVYQDSGFDDMGGKDAFLDTLVATKTTYTDPSSGTTLVGLQDGPYGWWNGAYIAVDPTNSIVTEADTPQLQPYTLFQTVSQDGPFNQYTDYTNPFCPLTVANYGYAQPILTYGYPCYKNVLVVTDCHSIVDEAVITYLSPGVGPVRLEHYITDTTGGKNIFYEDFSNTLIKPYLH